VLLEFTQISYDALCNVLQPPVTPHVSLLITRFSYILSPCFTISVSEKKVTSRENNRQSCCVYFNLCVLMY
jgi:hypothetical protein